MSQFGRNLREPRNTLLDRVPRKHVPVSAMSQDAKEGQDERSARTINEWDRRRRDYTSGAGCVMDLPGEVVTRVQTSFLTIPDLRGVWT